MWPGRAEDGVPYQSLRTTQGVCRRAGGKPLDLGRLSSLCTGHSALEYGKLPLSCHSGLYIVPPPG